MADGLVGPGEVHEPEPVDWDALAAVHDGGLLARIREGRLTVREQRGLGLPWSPELVERGRRAIGGTVAAARHALEPRRGHEPGRRHAPRGARLLARLLPLQRRGGRARGAAPRAGSPSARWSSTATCTRATAPPSIFAADDRTFTLSLHGARNYPFVRIPSDLDVEIPSGTGDDGYLPRWSEALDEALPRARADVAFYLAGADPWEGDRLGRLALTKAGLRARDELVLDRLLAAGVDGLRRARRRLRRRTWRDTVDINAGTAAARPASARPVAAG